MDCKHCGSTLSENTHFCPGCGIQAANAPDSRLHGYSPRIHDPAFARYLKNTSRWSAIFSLILAVAAVLGFYIYGETSREMENPQALFIGLGIGGMFLAVALYTVLARKASKTWDGVVIHKTVKKKSRRQNTNSDDYFINYYTEYAVIIRDNRGKKHRLTAEDDDTWYHYFKIGDQVRHHAGLNSYEKYDKCGDSIIFCNACATLCDISDEFCWRCKCPLLK